MICWEYMILCPDTDAGHLALFEAGYDGWEAVCSWKDSKDYYTNHVLFKRQVACPDTKVG